MLHHLNLYGWAGTAWCVPSAVAILTGAPVGHMHVRAAFITNQKLKDVKCVFCDDALLMLREQGYNAIPIDMSSRWPEPPTIEEFFAERTNYEKAMPIMFATDDHMMTCHYGFAADNWTARPVPVADFPELRRKVKFAWVVSKATTN